MARLLRPADGGDELEPWTKPRTPHDRDSLHAPAIRVFTHPSLMGRSGSAGSCLRNTAGGARAPVSGSSDRSHWNEKATVEATTETCISLIHVGCSNSDGERDRAMATPCRTCAKPRPSQAKRLKPNLCTFTDLLAAWTYDSLTSLQAPGTSLDRILYCTLLHSGFGGTKEHRNSCSRGNRLGSTSDVACHGWGLLLHSFVLKQRLP